MTQGQEETHENEPLDRLDEVGRKTVKVAASAVLASTLVGALAEPPRAELMSLPEPTPIVQMYQAVDDDPIDDEDETDESQNKWRRILRMLKYLMVALALAGAVLFGALKGCAGLVAAPLLLGGDDDRQEQTTQQVQTEDERGVAVAG